MFLLPRGNTLHEGVALARTNPPAVLEKMQTSRLTGYWRLTFPSAIGILLFDQGRLVSVLFEHGAKKTTGLDGLTAIFARIATEGGRLDIYGLTPDLARCVQALLDGETLYAGQELKLIDAKGLLEKMRVQKVNGCLRIYTVDRTALIFYKDGTALGFFHDGSETIETSASESQRIAGLPGAKLDVYTTRGLDEVGAHDLLEVVNVHKMWEVTLARHNEQLARLSQQAEAKARAEAEAKLGVLEESLRRIAAEFLGAMGRGLVDKELTSGGGTAALLEAPKVGGFLARIEKAARLLTGASQTERLLAALRTEIESHARSDFSLV